MKNRIAAFSLILAGSLLLSACDKVKSVIPTEPQTISATEIQGGDQVVPKNVIQIGDTFEFYPDKATGHFLCTVTGARAVTTEADCPPLEKFSLDVLSSYGEDGAIHRYDDWFTEDGAMARGCGLVLVDLTVTNVDAVAVIDEGGSTAGRGWFYDSYAFVSYDFGDLINTTDYLADKGLQGQMQYHYNRYAGIYFSKLGEFSETDIRESLGLDTIALKLLPGETVSFTLGYPVDTNYDGTQKPFSKMMFCIACDSHYERGTFVDLKLGEETPNQE